MGAMVYHTWRAKNWKIYRAVNVQKEQVITQIKKEFIDRIGRFRESKKNCINVGVLFKLLLLTSYEERRME